MKETTRKLLYPENRKEYHEAFIEAYQEGPLKDRLVESFGQAYYDEVMRIYKERLDKNDFNIGPQTVEQWEKLQKQHPKK